MECHMHEHGLLCAPVFHLSCLVGVGGWWSVVRSGGGKEVFWCSCCCCISLSISTGQTHHTVH